MCTTNGGRDKSFSWHPFRFPVGIDYLRSLPCAADPILGLDDAWLPVTHVGGPSRGPTDSGGIWFYYAQGCSDLLWHMGRTVLVRNRAHAAVRIEQMAASMEMARGTGAGDVAAANASAGALAHLLGLATTTSSSKSRGSTSTSTSAKGTRGGASARLSHELSSGSRDPAGGFAITEREAVRRVAAWIGKRYPKWAPLGRARGWAGSNATIEYVLAEAARGLYGHCTPPSFSPSGKLRPCRCATNGTKPAASRRRLLALTPVCGDKVLSLHSEPMLRRLPLDTLVLHKQPQGGGNPSWTTEIWDLRGSPALSRHLENASAHPEVVSRARWAGPGSLAAAATAGGTAGTAGGTAGTAGGTAATVPRAPLSVSQWPATCEPSDSWHTCFSCRGSHLERGCNGTVQHYRAHGACYWQKLKRGKSAEPASPAGAVLNC